MNRPALIPAYLVAMAIAGVPFALAPAVCAQSPAPGATPRTAAGGAARRPAGKTLGRSVTVNGGANRPVSAAQCNSRAAAMPGTGATGSLGPNGPSQSQTVVAVPIGSGDVATATRQQQIAEACAHVRR